MDATSFFILLVDLDYFKQTNDRYGHVARALVFKVVGKAVQGIVRQMDCFGHYGGEEFILFAKGDAGHDPAPFAEGIRQLVSLLMFADVPSLEHVTVSIANAEFHHRENFPKPI